MYERNENDELVRNIVEKAKKNKVTVLKKAILKKRARMQRVKDETKPIKVKITDDLSSGYVTVEELGPAGS